MKHKVKNPNTSILWDKRLFDTNAELLRSSYYIDKIKKVYRFLRGGHGRFLDIGFGMGNLERKLMESEIDLKIYGVDFSKRAVLQAKKKLKGKFYLSRVQELPFKDSFFDFVAMLDVLEHIPEAGSKKVLYEINRIIKKGGYFIVSVPLNENLEEMNKSGTNFNKHLRQYTPQTLESELNLSGFRVLNKSFIYAFKNYYNFKNFVIKFLPDLRKPNLMIVYCRKQ